VKENWHTSQKSSVATAEVYGVEKLKRFRGVEAFVDFSELLFTRNFILSFLMLFTHVSKGLNAVFLFVFS
jgi:hypothetical protein